MESTILEVENLHVTFYTQGKTVKAVRGINLCLNQSDTLAIVGESGSGKSVTSKAIMRVIPYPPGKIEKGKIIFNGQDILKITEKEMENIRGSEISMILQDPMTSLNPTMTIGNQIMEVLRKHRKLGKEEAFKEVLELIRLVGIPQPETRFKQYPHQFSGGMRQRIGIAIALACNPKILIADEPTTALDVTIQAQILDLLKALQEKTGTAIIIVTHDLGVVANIAKRVAVMYAGIIVETGTVDEIFYKPKHPYTWGLLSSMPRLNQKTKELVPIPGSPPDLSNPPRGCPFASRCPYVMDVCTQFMPDNLSVSETHIAACWLLDQRAPEVRPPEAAIL